MMLSTKRYPGETLEAAGERAKAGLQKLVRSAEFKRHVRGGVVSTEVARSRFGWGVHYHALIDCDYWAQEALSALWLRITGDSMVVWIKRVAPDAGPGGLEDAIEEVIKYPCKVAEVLDDDAWVREYLGWAPGRRMFRAFGSCVGALKRYEAELAGAAGLTVDAYREVLAVEQGLEHDKAVEQENECPCCGGKGNISIVAGLVVERWDCVQVAGSIWWLRVPLRC
jgi:hypothetical protein